MANVQFAIYAAYAGRLETAFLTDEVGSANAVLRYPAVPPPASPKSPPAAAPQADAADASGLPPAAKVCMDMHNSSSWGGARSFGNAFVNGIAKHLLLKDVLYMISCPEALWLGALIKAGTRLLL